MILRPSLGHVSRSSPSAQPAGFPLRRTATLAGAATLMLLLAACGLRQRQWRLQPRQGGIQQPHTADEPDTERRHDRHGLVIEQRNVEWRFVR